MGTVKKMFLFFVSMFLLVSFDSTRNVDGGDGSPSTWQSVLRLWCNMYDLNDEKRMAVVDSLTSVFDMVDDATLSAEQLAGPLCMMKETIDSVIGNDPSFEFCQMMRASARNMSLRLMHDGRLVSDCGYGIVGLDCRWQTSSGDVDDVMYTSLFPNSYQAMTRMANVILIKSDDQEHTMAVMIFANHLDTVMNNITVTFLQDNDTVFSMAESDMPVDSSDASGGVKRAFVPLFLAVDAMMNSNMMTVTYDTPNEHVLMFGVPQVYFREQAAACRRFRHLIDVGAE